VQRCWQEWWAPAPRSNSPHLYLAGSYQETPGAQKTSVPDPGLVLPSERPESYIGHGSQFIAKRLFGLILSAGKSQVTT
jgi:hypothetical protein